MANCGTGGSELPGPYGEGSGREVVQVIQRLLGTMAASFRSEPTESLLLAQHVWARTLPVRHQGWLENPSPDPNLATRHMFPSPMDLSAS